MERYTETYPAAAHYGFAVTESGTPALTIDMPNADLNFIGGDKDHIHFGRNMFGRGGLLLEHLTDEYDAYRDYEWLVKGDTEVGLIEGSSIVPIDVHDDWVRVTLPLPTATYHDTRRDRTEIDDTLLGTYMATLYVFQEGLRNTQIHANLSTDELLRLEMTPQLMHTTMSYSPDVNMEVNAMDVLVDMLRLAGEEERLVIAQKATAAMTTAMAHITQSDYYTETDFNVTIADSGAIGAYIGSPGSSFKTLDGARRVGPYEKIGTYNSETLRPKIVAICGLAALTGHVRDELYAQVHEGRRLRLASYTTEIADAVPRDDMAMRQLGAIDKLLGLGVAREDILDLMRPKGIAGDRHLLQYLAVAAEFGDRRPLSEIYQELKGHERGLISTQERYEATILTVQEDEIELVERGREIKSQGHYNTSRWD